LNARPLTYALPELAPEAKITYEVPSRLADDLAAGRLDVAMIPSIEYLRGDGYSIVSDACIACRGPVRSIKLFGRTPVERIRSLAIDDGSRTSAVLAQILLRERWGLQPGIQGLPIGAALEDAGTDAVLLIGDRGIPPANGRFEFVWDLGQEWARWTGLPFVFATWTARPDADLGGIDAVLAAARDRGVCRLDEIARHEAPILGLPEEDCRSYLRENLRFRLGPREREGMAAFFRLAAKHHLAPAGVDLG
jgi:chorismate dehydratase